MDTEPHTKLLAFAIDSKLSYLPHIEKAADIAAKKALATSEQAFYLSEVCVNLSLGLPNADNSCTTTRSPDYLLNLHHGLAGRRI